MTATVTRVVYASNFFSVSSDLSVAYEPDFCLA